jgi:phytol kinase
VHEREGVETELRNLVPTIGVVLRVAPIGLAVALLFGLLAGRLRASRHIAVPYTRKLFHIGIFSAAAGVQLTWGTPAVVVYGCAVVLVVLYAVSRGDGHPLYEALARPTDAPHRTLFILVPLATTAFGGLATNLLFDGRAAAVGYLVAGWGDAMGEPVGTRWGRHRYRVPSLVGVPASRSLEGSIAVLVAGTLAAGIALTAAGLGAATAWRVGAVSGLAGALVEAISNHGLDNITVQVAAAAAAALLLPA